MKSAWCPSRDLHISAKQSRPRQVDKNSRKFQDATEWHLNPEIHKAM